MPEKQKPEPAAVADQKHNVAVLGGGSFGSAIAKVLAENGHTVHFWMRDEHQAAEIRERGTNTRYMPGASFTGDVRSTTDFAAAVAGADTVFVASGNIIQRAKAMIPILVPLFVSAFRRANDLAMAMEARCYRGGNGRTKMKPLIYKSADHMAYLITILYVVIAFVVGRYVPFKLWIF